MKLALRPMVGVINIDYSVTTNLFLKFNTVGV